MSAALPVHHWPGPAPTLRDGLFAILISSDGPSAGAQRDTARHQIRQATREALAAVLQVPVDDIVIESAPGMAPHVVVANGAQTIGCSFSHEDNYSLAAVNLHGPIGADLMRVQDIFGWQAVARDYLGPEVAAGLPQAADRPLAFTQAWTRREAGLKCHALQLSEWQADLPGRSISLALPVADLVGHIHIGD